MGLKKALKLCDTRADADSLAANTPGGYVVERPATYPRCESYCQVGKAGICPQVKAEREARQPEKVEA